jgi:tetratricopeptide (TPR) repeat protein
VEQPIASDGHPAADREQVDAWFSEANQAFQIGQTREAADLYTRILQAGYESPDVWLNLGNAHFRLGEKGRAVHAFESGRRIAPGDPDLRSNLDLALRDVETAPEIEGSRALEALAASRDAFPMRQALPWVTGLWWGLAAWGSWSLYRRSAGRGGILLGLLLGIGWIAGVGWLGVLAVQADTRPGAVVTAESAQVRSNPDARATVEFHLPAGTLFRTGREAPGYVEVLYSDELRGWTSTDGIAWIGSP